MNTWIVQTVCGVIPGFNQSKNGTMNRDVCSVDIAFVEPMKITTSQANTGNQYLKKNFIQRSTRKRRTSNTEHQTSNGRHIPALAIER
jgi:hypothetical protein